MTKARTKAQITAAKRGRPKENGDREANGRLQRPSTAAAAREMLLDAPSGRKRCKRMGWHATPESRLSAAKDPRLATLPGCLNAAGRLSERAYTGVVKYGRSRERWLEAIGAPSEHPGIASYADVVLGAEPVLDETEVERVRRLSNRFMAAEGALLAAGGKAYVMDAMMATEDVRPMEVPSAAVAGLERAGVALFKHFIG